MSGAWQHTARAMPWQPQLVAAGVCLVFVGADLVPFVMATVLMATATAFGLDDPAHEFTAPAATSLLRRRLRRVALVLAPLGAVWSGLAMWRGADDAGEAWAVVLMFFGLTSLSLGIAAALAARSNGHGGQIAAPTVLGLLVASSIMSPRWRPMPLGDIPGGWSQIHLRWSIVALVGVAVFLVASRDPARR